MDGCCVMKPDLTLLVNALHNAAPKELPIMNEGMKYLFDNVYKRLMEGERIYLSELNLDSFIFGDLVDLKEIIELHIEENCRKASNILTILENAEPICVHVEYV